MLRHEVGSINGRIFHFPLRQILYDFPDNIYIYIACKCIPGRLTNLTVAAAAAAASAAAAAKVTYYREPWTCGLP